MADQDFVNERVVHVARENDVVTRRARVAEDVEDHLGGAAMSHPVFGVYQQWVTAPTEHLLHRFDQLDAKDRCRRDDDRRRVVQQCLLQFAQGFPVQQAGGLFEREFAAPAPRAGVEHHQGGRRGQHVMPLLEFQQRLQQVILRSGLQMVVVRLGGECLGLFQQIAKHIRLVTPALAQQVGQQGIADDAFGKRVTVGGFFPLSAEVPVIGDVVVVEDHQRREVSHDPRGAGQAVAEALNLHLLPGIPPLFLRAQLRRVWADQCPRRGRPDQQVHRDHFGKGDEVIVGGAAGENRLFHAAEKPFAQGLVAVQCGQQIGPVVIAGAMPVKARAVIHHGAFQVFVEQLQARDQRMNRPQHRPGHVVGVDLVTAHHQQGRALGRRARLGQQTVDAQQAFVGTVVRFAAGAMHQLMDAAV